jgi:hypothetical protein
LPRVGQLAGAGGAQPLEAAEHGLGLEQDQADVPGSFIAISAVSADAFERVAVAGGEQGEQGRDRRGVGAVEPGDEATPAVDVAPAARRRFAARSGAQPLTTAITAETGAQDRAAGRVEERARSRDRRRRAGQGRRRRSPRPRRDRSRRGTARRCRRRRPLGERVEHRGGEVADPEEVGRAGDERARSPGELDQPGEQIGAAGVAEVLDDVAAAVADREQAGRRQGGERGAQGQAADAERLGELAFGRQPRAGGERCRRGSRAAGQLGGDGRRGRRRAVRASS